MAAGESAFRQPEIAVWEITYSENNKVDHYKMLKCFKGHKFGVEAVRFSLNSKILISLGDQNDKGLFVWDW